MFLVNSDIKRKYNKPTDIGLEIPHLSLSGIRNLNEFKVSFSMKGQIQIIHVIPILQRQKAMRMLSTYTKIIIVRHPLERLYSAYSSKFVKYKTNEYSNDFQIRYSRQMMAFARKIPRKETPIDGKGLTFNEFLHYLSSHDTSDFQEHWKPMHQICHPCLIQYDYIGKFENIQNDSNEILTHLGIKDPVIRYAKPKPSNTASSLEELKPYFNDSVSEMLYKNFLPDYELFDYNKIYL